MEQPIPDDFAELTPISAADDYTRRLEEVTMAADNDPHAMISLRIEHVTHRLEQHAREFDRKLDERDRKFEKLGEKISRKLDRERWERHDATVVNRVSALEAEVRQLLIHRADMVGADGEGGRGRVGHLENKVRESAKRQDEADRQRGRLMVWVVALATSISGGIVGAAKLLGGL